jgi:hypothetical protein
MGRPLTASLDGAKRAAASERRQAIVGFWILGALLWITRLHFPSTSASPELDSSWQQALGYALVHRLQAGVDYWFTFGPLGYFDFAPYEPALYWPTLVAWELVFKALLCAVFVRALARRTNAFERVAGFLLLLFLPAGLDAWYFLCIVAITAPLVDGARPSRASLCLGLALLAIIALVKFTFFVTCFAVVVLLALRFAVRRSWWSGARIVALFAILVSLVWTLCGERPWNLVDYVRHSAWLASGYSEAQARQGPAVDLARAAIAAALCTGSIVLAALASPRGAARWLPFAVATIGLFMAFKAGFVDQGTSIVTFFGYTAVAPYLASSPVTKNGATMFAAPAMAFTLRASCAIVSIIGMSGEAGHPELAWADWVSTWSSSVSTNVRTLESLSTFHAAREKQLEKKRAEFDLPRMREQIGDRTVDQVGSRQAVLFLNRLHWHPRPVFQSYLTFTPDLVAANGEFFDADPPDFVIFSFETIDERLPGMEDAATQQRLWRDYRPLLVENGYLLLARKHSVQRASERRETLLERKIALGDTVSLDGLEGACLDLYVDIRYTLAGRLRKLLYKAPILHMESRLANGDLWENRILPGMLRTGVVVRPFLASLDDCVRIFRGPDKHSNGIASFRIVAAESDRWMLCPSIAVRVDRVDGLLPHAARAVCDDATLAPIRPPPDEILSMFQPCRASANGRSTLLVQAPSQMRFALRPGAHRLEAEYGILPDACAAGRSDGVRFAAVLHAPGSAEVALWDELLDPRADERCRSTQELRLDFRCDAPADLILRTGIGPHGDGSYDWAYWASVHIVDSGQ